MENDLLQLTKMNRWKAGALHLGVSLTVGVLVGALIFLLLYPQEFLRATGGKTLFALIVGVDVVVGPLLTLLVFDTRKASLKFDLSVIVALQLCAFCYGAYVTVQARPAYLVYSVDRFELVTAAELAYFESPEEAPPEYRSAPWAGPELVAAVLPSDPAERQRLLFISVTGTDLQHFPKYYRPYDAERSHVLKQGQPLASLAARRSESKDVIENWLARNHRGLDQVRVLPLHARKGDLTAMVDATSGAFLGALDVDPW